MATAERQTTIIDLPPGTAPHDPPAKHPLADLRSAALAAPVEVTRLALAEFKDRRDNFRAWLLAQLVMGVHYGVPPGCEPKGNPDPLQWRAKPSLYKAGAEFMCDLMNVRAEYEADLAAWEQLGKPVNTFVFKCRLFSRTNSDLIGEGTGARKVGQKGGDENNAVKMAQKNAMVAAVLNVYSLSDLFTQDEPEPAQYENPGADADAPKAQPRGERVTLETVKALGDRWTRIRQKRGEMVGKDEWLGWLRKLCGMGDDYDFIKTANWTTAHVQRVNAELTRLEATA